MCVPGDWVGNDHSCKNSLFNLLVCYSQVNGASRTSKVGSPVMLVDRILLVKVDLEKLGMGHTLVVLVPMPNHYPY